MGKAALTSHKKGKKHVEGSPSDQCIKSLMPRTPSLTPAPEPGNVSESSNEAGQQKETDKMLNMHLHLKLEYGGYSTLPIQNIK